MRGQGGLRVSCRHVRAQTRAGGAAAWLPRCNYHGGAQRPRETLELRIRTRGEGEASREHVC